jgi:hypothetical protein
MRGTVRRSGERPHDIRSSALRAGTIAALSVAVALLVVPTVVLAVDVRGTLTIPSDYAAQVAPEAEPQRARYWEEWNGVLEARAPRIDVQRELAVVLTGPGAASDGEQPPFRLHNGSLAPSTIVARAGTAIQIRNDDGVPYELFAEGNAELGPIQTAPGNARPVTLAEPGNWPIRDRVHPHVRGHLHALPDLVARATVEPSGAYTFRGVAPGTYQLHVFHGPREVVSQEVVVPEGGQLTVPAIQLQAAAAAPPAAEPAAAAAQP